MVKKIALIFQTDFPILFPLKLNLYLNIKPSYSITADRRKIKYKFKIHYSPSNLYETFFVSEKKLYKSFTASYKAEDYYR